MTDAPCEPSHEAIHDWFGLTYANYLVLPRAVLQSMPDEWQERFVACLRQLGDATRDLEFPASYDVRALARHADCITPYVQCPDCEDETSADCQLCNGDGEIEDPEGPRYETPDEVGFRTDPIPHYNRGRTLTEAPSTQ
jgi:hypothetical protein